MIPSGDNGHMNRTDTITSSEIADYVYCQEAWRLAQLGHESANRRERDAGTAHHAGKAVAVVKQSVLPHS